MTPERSRVRPGTAVAAGRAVALAVPTAFLAVFYAWPVAAAIGRGLVGEGAALGDLLTRRSTWSVVWFTSWQAAVSTAVTVVVALPAAHLIGRRAFRGRRLLRALVTVPFVLPTVVVAAAFEASFARLGLDDGPFRLRQTVGAIIAAHVFFNFAVVVRTVGSFWAGLDPRVEEEARMLGAGRLRTAVTVTLPRLAPALAAAAVVVFLFSFTSFGVVLVLGGPARATLETEIYRYAVARLDLATAAGLALVQLLAVAALVVVATQLERRRPGRERSVARAVPVRPALLVSNLALVAVVLGLPVFTLVERSLHGPGGYSLANYRALGRRVDLLPATATDALLNSVAFAAVATVIAVVVGVLSSLVIVHGRGAMAHVFDLGLTLPLGTSAVTLGLGMLVALDEPPLDLRTTTALVPIAHAVIGVPFVIRTLVPELRRIDPRLREAAAVLGAGPARVRREVDFAVAGRAVAVGAAFAFAVSLGEFGATAFVPRRPETLTAPLALFRLLGTPGEALRGQAMALAVVLMGLTASAVWVIDRLGDESGASF